MKFIIGSSYVGSTICASGLTCFVQSIYYSQCLISCPSGWSCSISISNGSSTSSPATIAVVPFFLNSSSNYSIIFPYCKFSFGISYSPNYFDYSTVDYITVWLGWPGFNIYWEGAACQLAKSFGKKPIFYAYFIAFMYVLMIL